MANIARERNSSTYTSGYRRYIINDKEAGKQTLSFDESLENMEDYEDFSTISGVEDNNPVNKFAKMI